MMRMSLNYLVNKSGKECTELPACQSQQDFHM